MNEKAADQQQAGCLKEDKFPSCQIVEFSAINDEGWPVQGYTREIFDFSELNNVGFCYYLLGRAFSEMAKGEEAH